MASWKGLISLLLIFILIAPCRLSVTTVAPNGDNMFNATKGQWGGGISEPKKLLQILAFYPSTFAPEIFREIYIEIKGGWG